MVAFFVSGMSLPLLLPRHEGRDHSVASFVSGVSLPLPCPFYTTQTRRTRPQRRVLRVWDVADTPDLKTRPYSRVLRVWGVPATFPAPSTAQTRRSRPCGRVLRVWGIPPTTSGLFPQFSFNPDTKMRVFVSGVFPYISIYISILHIISNKIPIRVFFKK